MANHLVIMAGGIGSRFWPMSTPQCPKQFLDITGCGKTMIQQTFERYAGIIDIEHAWVVTSKDYKDIVISQLQGINPQHVLLEPCMRNTAPCIAYVSWKIQKEDPQAFIAVAPSDHLVLKEDAFREYINKGLDFVSSRNCILTMGMQPSRPDTGYGYIEQGEMTTDGIYRLKSFREKPDLKTAISYLQQGGFTWNSGMFLWSVDTIVNELKRHNPGIANIMDDIQPYLFTDQEQNVINEKFPLCEKISIDYAVMEPASREGLVYTHPADFGWSDLGNWASLHDKLTKDANNNGVVGNIKLYECSNCVVHAEDAKKVVLQGLDGYIFSEKNGQILLCKRSEEQRIREFSTE
jgi:mannose-1-phosphate guanylyltransferase